MAKKTTKGGLKKKVKKAKVAKVVNQKAKWQYCFKTKEFQLNEIIKGKIFRISLNSSEFYSMNASCINHIERTERLAQNNKQKQHVTKE